MARIQWRVVDKVWMTAQTLDCSGRLVITSYLR
jgi:hypothetical protein